MDAARIRPGEFKRLKGLEGIWKRGSLKAEEEQVKTMTGVRGRFTSLKRMEKRSGLKAKVRV